MTTSLLLLTLAVAPPTATEPLAPQAFTVLRKHCYRCHGQEGSVEGGLNYLLDREKLVARRKVIPGDPEASRLWTRMVKGTMPPPEEEVRPTANELTLLHAWIQSGAPAERPSAAVSWIKEDQVQAWILADLMQHPARTRRFLRYFSLVPLAHSGAGADELQTYRHAVAKLLNSLSWHPKIRVPEAIDPHGLILRIDLRDFLWDAGLWNRLLLDYPYGVQSESGVARAVLVHTATRVPVVRADWFVATASRAPLYYDLLQIPANLGELERQLRVDVALNVQQERVARVGFNGSGVSRNNRLLERHDSMNGAYWRSYDFEAVPQNLLERNILTPDRRNLFAFPLGPGLGEAGFRQAGGEVIFNLPNGLQAYVLVDAANQRINKGPTEIVSDAKRPDRAVEAGLSCMHCHATGILPKDDQIREHVLKHPRSFSRRDRETIQALHPSPKKMRTLMAEDSQRHQQAVQRTGNKTTGAEVVLSMTLRYESDVDLPTLAAELGMAAERLVPALSATDTLSRNLGALAVPGGTVARQVVVQSFAELAREAGVGQVFDPGRGGESLPDATGDADPLEVLSHPANAVALHPEGKIVAVASQDRSVRLMDPLSRRDVRRLIGHTASVWSVAFRKDGQRILSGSKDGTVRLWETDTGRELLTLQGHGELVSAVAFAPDGRRALSASLDGEVRLWDLESGREVEGFEPPKGLAHPQGIAFSPDGTTGLVSSQSTLVLFPLKGKGPHRVLRGHTGWINAVLWTRGAVYSASDDGSIRRWEPRTGKELQKWIGHRGAVLELALNAKGDLISGGADGTVRLWTGPSQAQTLRSQGLPVRGLAFSPSGLRVVSVDRGAQIEVWPLTRETPSK
jgi:WD40 repeat protein